MLLSRLSVWIWSLWPLLLVLLIGSTPKASAQSATVPAEPPRKSNGLTDVVQWDNYTLFLHNQRMFLK